MKAARLLIRVANNISKFPSRKFTTADSSPKWDRTKVERYPLFRGCTVFYQHAHVVPTSREVSLIQRVLYSEDATV
jgi:hypothetical protein